MRESSVKVEAGSAPSAGALLGLAAERALPEELLLAAMAADPAREDEEQVGETVQVGERPFADVLLPHETEHVALGAPADRTGDVEKRAHRPAARKDERLERCQVLLAAVERLLEGLHLGGADPEHPRLECVGRGRELAPEIEELVLEMAQDVVELAGLLRARRGPVHRAHDADGGVQLVDGAVRVDARAILRDPQAADE